MLMKESNHLDDIANVDVLIIDEQVELCLLMKAYLLRKGCEVAIRHTPESALSFLHQQKPDVILIDRWICLDIDSFMEQVKAIAPYARIVVQKLGNDKPITKKELEMIKNFGVDKPMSSDKILSIIVVLIIILIVLQIVVSSR